MKSRTNESGFISVFVIAVVVAAVAAAGVGIYLYKKAMAAPESPPLPKETQKETGEVGKMGFGCKDILTKENFNKFGYNIEEFNIEDVSSGIEDELGCLYSGEYNTKAFGSILSIGIYREPRYPGFEAGKANFPQRIAVTDVGSDAYYTQPDLPLRGLWFLSSNRKYSAIITGGLGSEEQEYFNIVKEIAKIIDENLNRY